MPRSANVVPGEIVGVNVPGHQREVALENAAEVFVPACKPVLGGFRVEVTSCSDMARIRLMMSCTRDRPSGKTCFPGKNGLVITRWRIGSEPHRGARDGIGFMLWIACL